MAVNALPPIIVCGGTGLGNPNPPAVTVYKWVCPYCDGKGIWNDEGERCMNCSGYGLTNEARGFEEDELTPAPMPPAVMRNPCVDCAYRPGSPEDGSAARPGPETPFYCHHGLHRVGDGYVPTALLGETQLPVGAMVCAGWWALATGRPLPERAFRDPGGSDRREDAPDIEGAA